MLVINEQTLNEFAEDLTVAHIPIEQPNVYNTPIFMVAIKGGPNVRKKQFVQDFRKQNLASQYNKKVVRYIQEPLTEVNRPRPKIPPEDNSTNALYSSQSERSPQSLTPFTPPFKNTQYYEKRIPQGLKRASTSSPKLHQPMLQEGWKLLDIMSTKYQVYCMKQELKKWILGVEKLSWSGYLLDVPIQDQAILAPSLDKINNPGRPWRKRRQSESQLKETTGSWEKWIQIILRPTITFPDFSLPFSSYTDLLMVQEQHDRQSRKGAGASLTRAQDGIAKPTGYFKTQLRESGYKYNAYDTEQLIHGRRDAEQTIALFGQPLPEDYSDTKETHQARTATRIVKTTNASLFETIKLLNMPNLQERSGRPESTLHKEREQYILNLQQSLTPGAKNIVALYSCRSNFDTRGCLFYVSTPNNRHVSPGRLWLSKPIEGTILHNHHKSTPVGHSGELGTYELITTKYPRSTTGQDVDGSAQHSKMNQHWRDPETERNEGPLEAWETPTNKKMRMHMNIMDPTTPNQGQNYVLK